MAKKMFLNVLYNICIFVCLIAGYQYGIEKGNYVFLAGAVFIIAIFIALKVRLLKEVKKDQKNL
jgi:SNF family Na+-dependent transporter